MILGITGTRKDITEEQRLAFHSCMEHNDITELHHGGCKGADIHIAYETNRVYPKINVIEHLPKHKESKFFLQRNRDIVNICDVLWAFPSSNEEEKRSGTWATIRYAKKKHKPTRMFYPDGSLSMRVYT